MNTTHALFVGLLLVGSTTARPQTPYVDLGRDPSMVTLIQVLANPEAYHGKEIEFVAYLNLSFESDALWLHKEDRDNAILGNSIWVEATPEMTKVKASIHHCYVLIKGIFNAHNHGHLGSHSGALTKISSCMFWSDPKKPRANQIAPPLPPPPSSDSKKTKAHRAS